jgi:hypothetical protein
MAQLENYVKMVYGAEVDARSYLHKFFTISTDLPQNRQDTHENDYAKYFRRLSQHYGLDDKPGLDTILVPLFRHYWFSLREIERCFTILALYFAHIPSKRLPITHVISFLAILRLKFPDVFYALAASKLSYDDLVDKTGIDRIEQTDYSRFPKDRFICLLKFLLLTEDQYNALDEKDAIHRYGQLLDGRFDMTRTKVMALLCSDLIRFEMEEI